MLVNTHFVSSIRRRRDKDEIESKEDKRKSNKKIKQ